MNTLGSVLIDEALVEGVGNALGASPGAKQLLRTCLLALVDETLLVLNHNLKRRTIGCKRLLAIEEALETLLLALERSEGLGATLGELGGELGVVKRRGAEVVAIHWVYCHFASWLKIRFYRWNLRL